MKTSDPYDLLLSVPPNMCTYLETCEPHIAEQAFATFDPPGQQLGSGGGTAHVLEQAWRAGGGNKNFSEWIAGSGKLIIHGGGESRRLPAYAAPGKLFIPTPVFRWSLGQKLDQSLLDLMLPNLQKVAQSATKNSRLMIASGDVLVHLEEDLPELPDADVIFFGLWSTPEEAQNFGVMLCERDHPEHLVTFLQKPSPDLIREKSRDHLFLIDVGIWLLSDKAIRCLMNQCGWDPASETFSNGLPENYDLYGKWALSLGSKPEQHHPEFEELTTSVVTLSEGRFFHFGTSKDMLKSLYELQNLITDQTKLGAVASLAQPRQFVQNAIFQAPLRREQNHSLWVENSHIPSTWSLSSKNILTGVPENKWSLQLESGVCLDFVPLEDDTICLRVYGYDDVFRGTLKSPLTRWMNVSPSEWLKRRGISWEQCGLDGAEDLQHANLFPALDPDQIDPDFVRWMFAENPEDNELWKQLWLESKRLSAAELGRVICLKRLYEQRRDFRHKALPVMARNAEHSVFYKLDLEATASIYAESPYGFPPELDFTRLRNPLIAVHDCMFRAAVRRRRGESAWMSHEQEAFLTLRKLIVSQYSSKAVEPYCTVLDEQIVWGRCPVRLDFSGGWTDTPPYCLEHGGSVLNVAVNLNGQPPVQVFARKTMRPELVVRSIDLGISETLYTYEDVRAYDQRGSGFTIARAAFAMAGFHPDFNGGAYKTLAEQLQAFEGGIEISMLAAIPKGSGLGTSSMLAATLLGVIADFCGLNWDKTELLQRTMALEQMLTSGGGWQDQVGGVLPGVKLVETTPGLEQKPIARWLPAHFFEGDASKCFLLYYTGITRIAHDILGEVVRGIFLNSSSRLETLKKIRQNTENCFDAVQRHDFEGFAACVRESWELNNELDPGTTTPEVDQILREAQEELLGAKLLGAGGGGYLLMVARDEQAAAKVKTRLERNPINAGARFVDVSLSDTGLQITRS